MLADAGVGTVYTSRGAIDELLGMGHDLRVGQMNAVALEGGAVDLGHPVLRGAPAEAAGRDAAQEGGQ